MEAVWSGALLPGVGHLKLTMMMILSLIRILKLKKALEVLVGLDTKRELSEKLYKNIKK